MACRWIHHAALHQWIYAVGGDVNRIAGKVEKAKSGGYKANVGFAPSVPVDTLEEAKKYVEDFCKENRLCL